MHTHTHTHTHFTFGGYSNCDTVTGQEDYCGLKLGPSQQVTRGKKRQPRLLSGESINPLLSMSRTNNHKIESFSERLPCKKLELAVVLLRIDLYVI